MICWYAILCFEWFKTFAFSMPIKSIKLNTFVLKGWQNKSPLQNLCWYSCMKSVHTCLLFQSTQWKSSGREITKSGLHMPGRDPVFTSPVSAAKPSTPVSAPQHNTPKEVKTSLGTAFSLTFVPEYSEKSLHLECYCNAGHTLDNYQVLTDF